MGSSPLSNDPFTALEGQYNVGRLVWTSKSRGSLEQEPPIQLSEDPNDGTIRIQKSTFLDKRIQVGCQLLLLQGKKVADYKSGFEEIQKTLKENLYIEVVVLKHSKPSSLVASPTKTSGAKLHNPGQKGWTKVSPIPKKKKLTSSTRKKDKKSIEEDLPFVPRIWASNKRSSITAPVPFQLVQDNEGTIRIQDISPALQKNTRIRVGQQLVELQDQDIDSYHDLKEIQTVIEETLEINFVVANAKPKENPASPVKKSPKKKKKKKKSSSTSSADHEPADVPSPPLSAATIHTEASSGMESLSQSVTEPSVSTKQAKDDSLAVSATPTKKSKGSWLKSKLSRSSARNKRVSPMM